MLRKRMLRPGLSMLSVLEGKRKAYWLAASLVALISGATQASERVALVVGNANYGHAPALDNPRNDAEDIAAALTQAGFSVETALDVDRSEFGDKFADFARRTQGARAALFYYAGHGLQVAGENYLLPVDAELTDETALGFQAVRLGDVLKGMRSGTNLVFLDACRDNPFANKVAALMGTRSSAVGRGLAPVARGSLRGTFIAYATAAGDVASDGDGRNSPFTAALKRHMATPGLTIGQVMTRVRGELAALAQEPWDTSSLKADFYFVPPSPASATPDAPSLVGDVPDPCTEMWMQIRERGDIPIVEQFLSECPRSAYRPPAEARLAALRQQATPIQGSGTVTFTLDNQSGVNIEGVYAGPNNVPQWGENLLGAVLLPGSQQQFDVAAKANHCVFDIRVTWANGFYQFMENLCEDPYVKYDRGRGFVVSNQSQTTITKVYGKSVAEESWGSNGLGEEVISPGFERVFVLEESVCKFDIALHTPATNVEYLRRDLCDDPTIVFYEGNELTVVNKHDVDIYFIRTSLDHESQGWGQNLLADEGLLFPDEELVVQMHQFSEHQCLLDLLIEDADGQEYVYEQVEVCKTGPFVHSQGATGIADLPPGETFRDCDDGSCPWMVVVNGGTYERGSMERDEETPVKEVTVPGPFAVGEFEVSVGQFREFVRDNGHIAESGCHIRRRGSWRFAEDANWLNPGFKQDDSHPVVCVSWNDAKAYTEWLTEQTGEPYRLPTEAEAELLARTSAVNFEQSGRANCRNCGTDWDGRGTSPVGRLGSDRLGLSGIFGNAAEWMEDCYQSGYSNAPRDGSAWSPPSCERRVVRGGCSFTSARELRASGRDYERSGRRSTCVGFRVARGLSP